jgi:hypothetical protein
MNKPKKTALKKHRKTKAKVKAKAKAGKALAKKKD